MNGRERSDGDAGRAQRASRATRARIATEALRAHPVARRLDAVAALGLSAALALPAAIAAVSADPGASVLPEGHEAAPWPRLSTDPARWAEFPKRFASAFGDRLGGRHELLRARNAALVFALGASPTPKIVFDEELRVHLDDLDLLAYLRGARPLSVAELRSWRRALESRARFVAAHGGRLVLAIAPENATVYADRAPAAWRSIGPSRLDQLLAYFAADAPCVLLDLRGALQAARALDREDDPACYRHGTHWTPRGAFAAARAIATTLARELPQYPAIADGARDDVRFEPSDGIGDSWAGRLHLDGLLVQSDRRLVDPGQRWQAVAEPRFEGDQLVTHREDVALPTAIVVHDSFGAIPRSVLPRTFSRATFLWQPAFPSERIARERPDVVLLLFGERFLCRPAWPILGGASDADLAAEIAAGNEVLERLDAGALSRGCVVRGPLELAADEQGLRVRDPDGAGLLLLPPIASDPAVALTLELDVEVERDTRIAVLFTTAEEREYARSRIVRAPVARGRSVVVIEIGDPARAGRFAVRIEDVGAPWTLRGVTARGRPAR